MLSRRRRPYKDVLPAVLSVIFCEIERKLGWIKEGDLKLN